MKVRYRSLQYAGAPDFPGTGSLEQWMLGGITINPHDELTCTWILNRDIEHHKRETERLTRELERLGPEIAQLREELRGHSDLAERKKLVVRVDELEERVNFAQGRLHATHQ